MGEDVNDILQTDGAAAVTLIESYFFTGLPKDRT